MDKDTTKSTFNKVFESLPYEDFCNLIAASNVDKYVKKLKMIKLLYILVIAQMTQTESLIALADKITQDEYLQKALHLTSISASALSRRIRSIHHDSWAQIFSSIARNTTRSMAAKASCEPKDYRINIIDASTISLCLSKYLWAEFRGTKAGIKLHQRVMLHEGQAYPDKAILTPAKPADRSQLDELVNTDKDVLNVFDRGYVDYKRWDDYCEQGIRFVSRLKANAIIDVVKSGVIQVNGSAITERTVVLGKPQTTQMQHPLRLFETHDSQGNPVIIVTNDFGMDALDITEIYRLRWQVELFFKWVKQHLRVKKFYGTSPNAVYRQIWIALITFCLLRIVQQDLPKSKTLLDVLRAVVNYLYQPFEQIVSMFRRSVKRSLGRRRFDYLNEFERLTKQLEEIDTSCLDEMVEELYV